MSKQHSYGIIPLRFHKNEWQVFLIRQWAGHWGFPKGHPEPLETPRETAQRELFEETGLSVVKFLPFEELHEHYTFTHAGKKIEKEVTYFMAEVEGEERLQQEEIGHGKWISLPDALKTITFEEGRNICLEAQRRLT